MKKPGMNRNRNAAAALFRVPALRGFRVPGLLLLLALLIFAGCGKPPLQDGTFSARSGPDDDGAWGEVTLTITGGKIADCLFITRQRDGAIKAEDYGRINGEISNQAYYDKAQLAVRAMEKYARELGRTGDLNAVEAVSGATISHNQFREAVEEALDTARKK
jgi:major membrane immunogen (membrane-anchored lipoprotein)